MRKLSLRGHPRESPNIASKDLESDATESNHARLRLIISGRVQGVYFRASATVQAERLGLTGYARNRSDRTVEIVAEGPADALKSFIEWARHGPPDALVDHLSEQWLPFLAEFDSFRVA